MDKNRSAEPGMPWIKNLAPVGNVGVLAFTCTTPSGPIPRLISERRAKHVEPAWKRKKQHEIQTRYTLKTLQSCPKNGTISRPHHRIVSPYTSGNDASDGLG
jgi:ribosomal protein L32